MSLPFSDTTDFKGLVQMYEKECGMPRGTVSSDPDKLREFAADVNEALDDFFALALTASGKWQLDDSNHTTYPIIYSTLTAGVSDYPLTADNAGNLILDVEKVMILPSATATQYVEIEPIDQQTQSSGLDAENGTSGVSTTYDKTANAIFLDPKPGYTIAKGLKVYINREGSYFKYSDTTKKPGVPGLFHKYFYLKPALKYGRRNSIQNYNAIEAEVLKLEGVEEKGVIGQIARYFGKRAKDERSIMSPRITPYV